MTRHTFLLRGARVYRHDGDTDLPSVADVLVRDGAIAAVGAVVATPEDATVVDLSGHLLMPGFVNSHYHSHDVLAKGLFECLPLEHWGLVAGPLANNRSLEEVRLRTLLGAVEALRNGITTVQDFSSFAPMEPDVVDTILLAYREAGLRVVYAITVRDQSQLDTILDAKNVVPQDLHSLIGTSRGDTAAQLAFVESEIDRVGDQDGLVVWALSPSAPQRCSETLLRGVGEIAMRRKLPVYTHVYESRVQRLFATEHFGRYGGSMVNYMEDMGLVGPHVTIAHGVWPDPSEIEHLARTGTGVVLNMLSNLRLRNGVAPISAYRRLGVPLALGSDNCSCSDVHSLLPVMKNYCLLGGIMDIEEDAPTAAEAIRLATLGGARAAGCAERFGAIEPGLRADLVAFDCEDPAFRPLNSVARQLVFAETGRAIRKVWVDGRLVVDKGRATRVDEEKLVDDVAAIMPSVRSKLDALRADAGRLTPFLREMTRRATLRPLTYDRYLSKN
jgi:5-methylthioadenosine/S-adenosylhomocysteine deaminase